MTDFNVAGLADASAEELADLTVRPPGAAATPPQAWFVYLLECVSGRIYTGATPDVARRLQAHASGRGARFTRMDPPRQLLAARVFASKGEALRAEARVKRLSPPMKRALAVAWIAKDAAESADGFSQ